MNRRLGEGEKVVEELSELSQELGPLVQKMESLKDKPEKRDKIRQLFLSDLSRRWTGLSPRLQTLTRWEEVVKLQEDLRDFITDSKRVILSPDRAEVLNLLEDWCLGLNLRPENQLKDLVEKSLEEAGEQNIQNIRECLNELQTSVLQEANLQNQFQRWVRESKLEELLKQEKTSDNFLEWLQSVQRGLQHTLNLEKEMTTLTTKVGAFRDNVITEALAQKFVQVLWDEIKTFTPEKAPGFWGEKKTQTVKRWNIVKPYLEHFKLFKNFSASENTLVTKEVKGLEVHEYSTFNMLLGRLEEDIETLQRLKKTLDDIESQTASLPSNNNVPEEVNALSQEIQNIHADIPDASQYASTKEYLDSLNSVKERFEEWEEKFEAAQEHLKREIDFWMTVCEKQDSAQFLNELRELRQEVGTIGKLIQSICRLREISEELKQNLIDEPAEGEVLNKIISLLEYGETNLLKIMEALPEKDFEKYLVSLARKKIIEVIVKTT